MYVARLPFDEHLSGGIDGTVEALVSKVAEVVAQQVVCVGLYVVLHMLQAVVCELGVHRGVVRVHSGPSLRVVERDVAHPDGVGAQDYAVASQVVVGVGGVDMCAGLVHQNVAVEVDLFEGSEDSHVACGTACEVGEDARGELVQEIEVAAVCVDVEVDAAAWFRLAGCDGALHGGLVVVGRVFHACFQQDAAFALTPVGMYVHVAHAAAVEGEILHLQVGVGRGFVGEVASIDATGGDAIEIHGVEVDDVEDVSQVDAMQVGRQRIGLLWRHTAAHAEILLALRNLEAVEVHRLVAVLEVGWMDGPQRVADDEVRLVHQPSYTLLPGCILEEACAHVHLSDLCAWRVVVPVQSAAYLVAGRVGIQSELHGLAFHLAFES